MQTIDTKYAIELFRNAHVPEGVIDSIRFMYHATDFMPLCVADCVCKLHAGGMNGDSIIDLIENASGTNFIFSPRHFFHELGPLAKRFGFSSDDIARYIAEFDSDLAEYSIELVGRRYRDDKFNNPEIMVNDKEKIFSACAAPGGKYWRAAVDFASWFKLVHKSDADTLRILNRCVTARGVNMSRMMQMTTGRYEKMLSHTDGQTMRPKINMEYIRYVNNVHRFFAENEKQIRAVATRYKDSDIDFMNAFYDLCADWHGWLWKLPMVKMKAPDIYATQPEVVRWVMIAITNELPDNVARAIMNVAEYDFTRIMPPVEHESIYDMLGRYVTERKN